MFLFLGKAIYSWTFKKFLNTVVIFFAKFIPPSSEGTFPEDQRLAHRKGHWTVDLEFIIINISMYYIGILSELVLKNYMPRQVKEIIHF